MVSAAYPVACYVFFFSFTFFILTQSHENSSLNIARAGYIAFI
jgi:hypothetical protein